MCSSKDYSIRKVSRVPEQDFYAGADGIIVGLGQNWRDLVRTNEK
jgi:hypothetical protein